MAYIQRKLLIQKLLQEKGACSIHYLTKHLYVSTSTLRRDLIEMEEEGVLKRYHGGVAIAETSSTEDSVSMRRSINVEKKTAIAKLAAMEVRDGMVLFLDSSSTASHLCPFLKACRDLTVVTNGIQIAQQLSAAPEIKCYLCPGLVKQRSSSIVGEYSADFLNNFHADIVFFSCKAINTHGVFEGDDAQAMIKRNMLQCAERKILLCDTTKEYASGYFKLVGFRGLNCVISEQPFRQELSDVIGTAGCRLETAKS